ncbi:hypothetical protein [Pseudomonas sp. NPDC086278]|uniref:hypothetical protein n=1 Tax=Pseudomonas sp. NPDC086278 TaxID=3390646 RepID=UPI003D05E2E2
MELKRYQKTRDEHGRARLEVCDSNMFVAFWSDCKYISARDRQGVEWLLARDTALRFIEAGDGGLIRVHHSCLVRRDGIDAFHRIGAKKGQGSYGVVSVAGHVYRTSRDWVYTPLTGGEGNHNGGSPPPAVQG